LNFIKQKHYVSAIVRRTIYPPCPLGDPLGKNVSEPPVFPIGAGLEPLPALEEPILRVGGHMLEAIALEIGSMGIEWWMLNNRWNRDKRAHRGQVTGPISDASDRS
jgi:hypothetical protein